MKILVVSDSHGMLDYMRSAIRQEKPDYVIHLGDHARDAEALGREFPILPIVSVRGNCDYGDFDIPEHRLVDYGGIRVLMTHGHRYGVKTDLLRYDMTARENEVDVALFGHTHCAYCENSQGHWLMNPGSCGYHRPSCGIIEIHDRTVLCRVRPISSEEENL